MNTEKYGLLSEDEISASKCEAIDSTEPCDMANGATEGASAGAGAAAGAAAAAA